jgi:hypothetical protein
MADEARPIGPASRHNHPNVTRRCPAFTFIAAIKSRTREPSTLHVPRVPPLVAFGRRPRCQPNRRDWAVIRNPSHVWTAPAVQGKRI